VANNSHRNVQRYLFLFIYFFFLFGCGDVMTGNRRPSRMGVSAYDHRPAQQQQQQQRGSAIMGSQSHIAEAVYPEATKPPLMTFMSRARILSMTSTIDSFQSQCANVDTLATSRHHHQSQSQLQSIEPFYNDPLSSIGAPPSFADAEEQVADVLLAPVHHAAHHVTASSTSLHSKFKSHEPIYASLSETLSSSHTLESVEGPAGSLLDEFAPNLLRQREIDDDDDEEEEDEGSATESAGDDFEFHNIRTSRQTLITPPNDVVASAASTEVVFGLEDLRPRSRVARSATYRILCNGLDVKCAGKHDTMAVTDDTREVLAATSESRHGIVTCVTIQVNISLYSFFFSFLFFSIFILWPPSREFAGLIITKHVFICCCVDWTQGTTADGIWGVVVQFTTLQIADIIVDERHRRPR
jgi:hypothetical protein